MAMSYQCTFAPVYPDSIDFLKGHTFHPHSATAWQHPGHSYDFLLYFPRKSSGHLPVLFMTPFHVSHSRTPRKDRSFLQDPIQMVKNWTVSIFLGGCQKIRFVDFCGFARWQLVHGPFVVHSWWNGRKFRKIAALPTVSLRNSANKLKSLAYVFVNFVDSAIAKVRKGIPGGDPGGWWWIYDLTGHSLFDKKNHDHTRVLEWFQVRKPKQKDKEWYKG